MGKAIVRIGELRFEAYSEGMVNNFLTFSELPNSKQHSSGIDNDIVISATPTRQIVDADLDVEFDSNLKFVYSVSTDNKLRVAFKKEMISGKAEALESLQCVSVIYELGQLISNGNLYYVVTRNSQGEEMQRTTPLPLNNCMTLIEQFDSTRDVIFGGFLKHEVMKSYTVI